MKFALKLALFVCLSGTLLAQRETATLRGTVADRGGAPVPGVSVYLTGTGGFEREVVTDKGGHYLFEYLQPGSYALVVDQRGVQIYVAEGITLDPGAQRRVDPKVEPGAQQDAAKVDLSEPKATPESGAIRNTLDLDLRWQDAPVAGKAPTPFSLMTTTPGVQGNGRGLVISGNSSRHRQTWMIDGIADDTTDLFPSDGSFFESVTVTAATPGADTYRPTGFDMITRRGSNEFHGLVYYRLGSSALDARPYFQTGRTRYTRHEEHGEVGGPIFKNRLFFYGGWTHQSNRYNRALFADVPTAQMRTGDFSQFLNAATSPTGAAVILRDPRSGLPFTNNAMPGNRITTASANIMNNYYPAPNRGDANTFLQNYTWDHRFGSGPVRADWPVARLDYNLPNGNRLYFRYLQAATSTVAPGTTGDALRSTQTRRYQNYAISDTQDIAPGVVNHFRAGYNTNRGRQGQEVSNVAPLLGNNVLSTIGLQGTNVNGYDAAGFPPVSITGITGLAMQYPGAQNKNKNLAEDDTILTLSDSVSWWKGRHSVKLGFQFTRYQWLQGAVPPETFGSFNFTGQFTGVAFADFLLGLPATSTRLLNPRIDSRLRQRQGGVWLTDNFRVTPRLTLDYGIRWDYFGSPTYNDGYMYNWNPSTGQVIVAPGTLTAVTSIFPKTIPVVAGPVVPEARLTNIRPRVSAAYKLADNLVLRGGYGEFTDGGPFGAGGRINDPNGPYRVMETYYNSVTNGVALYTFPRPFPTTLTPALTPTPSISALPMETREGVIRQYNATVERGFGAIAVRASYIGSRGTNMNYSLDINKPTASATPFAVSRLPYQQFASTYVTRTDGEWRYDAAQVQVQKRAGAVSFDSSFTWSRNRSNYANTFDPYNVTSKWTPDAADRRLYFVTSAVWAIPSAKKNSRIFGDWTLQAIGTVASGQRYSVFFTGPDPANASRGFVTGLADCVGDASSGAGSVPRWFNPAAFAIPTAAAGRYGTCGMNSLEGYPIHVAHVSLNKRLRLGESAAAILTIQGTNVTNAPHFTTPNNNLSTPGAGLFTASSAVDEFYPEKQSPRQISVKLRLQW